MVIAAPVSYSQEVVGPLIVFTVICGRLIRLLIEFVLDVFSAIFHAHICIINSMFTFLKGSSFSWLLLQLTLGASEELESSFLSREKLIRSGMFLLALHWFQLSA